MLAKKSKIQEPKVAKTKSKSSFTRRKNHFLDLLEDAIAANHREIRDSRKLLNEAQERVIDIDPNLSVRNFGVWFDSHLSMSRHVTKLCNSSSIIYIILGALESTYHVIIYWPSFMHL